MEPANAINWTEIIVAVVSVIGGLGLGRLLFFRANKKKANAEADNVALEGYQAAFMSLREDKEQAVKDAATARVEAAKAQESERETLSRLMACYDDICVHKGCRLRKPHQGQGMKWYEQYKEDPSLGCDYESIDTLIKRERAKRLSENIAKEEKSEE